MVSKLRTVIHKAPACSMWIVLSWPRTSPRSIRAKFSTSLVSLTWAHRCMRSNAACREVKVRCFACGKQRKTRNSRRTKSKVLSSNFILSIKNITPARDPKQCGEKEMMIMIIYLGDIRYWGMYKMQAFQAGNRTSFLKSTAGHKAKECKRHLVHGGGWWCRSATEIERKNATTAAERQESQSEKIDQRPKLADRLQRRSAFGRNTDLRSSLFASLGLVTLRRSRGVR